MTDRSVLKKGKKSLYDAYDRYRKKKKKLSSDDQEKIEERLTSLQSAISEKDLIKVAKITALVQNDMNTSLKKAPLEKVQSFVIGVGGALLFAILIRQLWFELYEIPTGSMRPTFKEQDRLAVSKTDFSINYPLNPGHFYFNPKLIKRNSIVTFTVKNMDLKDGNTVYFYLFPGKKLLIKRVMGKPGDTVYFYGGKIYGIDAEGNDITPELQLEQLEKIDHIPFISFEGTRVSTKPSSIPHVFSPVILYQMNEPLARLYALNEKEARGAILQTFQLKNSSPQYGNIWGMENFAMARLLKKSEVLAKTDQNPSLIPEGVLYLELKHSPSLSRVKIAKDEYNRLRPMLTLSTSIIPLQEADLKTLMDNLYTARFVVNQQLAHRYGINRDQYQGESPRFFPHFSGLPDGTYEFYYGKAFQIKWGGISYELPRTHPIYQFDPERIQQLFNVGMEFDNRFQSYAPHYHSSRYAYFRDGDLYVMGAPLMRKENPTLVSFIEREKGRQSSSYDPFIDKGPPINSQGGLDKERVKQFGLKVPARSYLVLGDNHAGSGDSRDFGFVPEENLRGGPSFIFWPPGSRIGRPNQPSYALINPARVTIWGFALVAFGSWYFISKKRKNFNHNGKV